MRLLLAFSIFLIIEVSFSFRTLNHIYRKFKQSSAILSEYPEQWFDQKLDHFDLTNVKLWKQRYFVNSSFYKASGPAFIQIGGEGIDNPTWMTHGTWLDYAKEHKAICFSLEHRFYGKSHPTADLSVKHLKFLNSRQALEDVANFIVSMTQKYNLPSNVKWVAFGGSYSGALAAWMRHKYPHWVYAAVASSAPVLAQFNFIDYVKIVINSLKAYSNQCVDNIRKGTELVRQQLSTNSSAVQVKFHLCHMVNVTKSKDISNLFEVLADRFMEAVQYNEDNNGFENGHGRDITIPRLCDIMNNVSIGSELDRLALVNRYVMSFFDEKCVNFAYNKMIDDAQQTSWNSSVAVGGRQWIWQKCTEFAYFQTSDYSDKVFGDDFPLNFSIQQCIDIFGPKYNKAFIIDAVKQTNIFYGGKDLKSASRIIFPNGSLDPWHALGITLAESSNLPVVFMNGTAHCADMYPVSSSDLPSLVMGRKKIREHLKLWLAKPSYTADHPMKFSPRLL